MYGGQGKITNNISLTSVTTTRDNGENVTNKSTSRTTHGGLVMKKLRERENTNSANRISNAKSGSRQHNDYKSHWAEHTGQVAYESTPLP